MSYFSRRSRLLIGTKAGTFAVVVVSSLAVCIGAWSVFIGLWINSADVDSLGRNVVLSVFINNEVSGDGIELENQKRKLLLLPYFDSAWTVDAEQAKREFEAKYGEAGEELLPSNPFLPSVVVHVRPEYRSVQKIDSIAGIVQAYPEVHSVRYREGYVSMLSKREQTLLLLGLCSTAIAVCLFLSALYSSVRRATDIPREEARFMWIAGVARSTVVLPYVFFSVAASALGAAASVALIAGAARAFPELAPWIEAVPRELQYAPVACVLALAAMAALWLGNRSFGLSIRP